MIKIKNTIAPKYISFNKLHKLIQSQNFHFKINLPEVIPVLQHVQSAGVLSGFELP